MTAQNRLATACLAVPAALVLACGGAPASSPVAVDYSGLDPLVIELPIGPDWMAAGFDSVWVKRDDGHVNRLDPATGEVLAEIDTAVTSEDLCQGLGISSTTVYTCSGQDIVQIDPDSNTIRGTVSAGKVFAQGRLVVLDGQVWVLAGQGEQLVAISEADGTVADPIVLPVACSDLTQGTNAIIAVCPSADRVLRVDPSAKSVTAEETVSEPTSASVNGTGVWVGTADGVLRLDPVTLTRGSTVADVVPGSFGTVWANAEGVFVRRISTYLTRIDPATGFITHTLKVPLDVGPFDGGGDVVGFGDWLWTSDSEAGVVVRLNGFAAR